MDLAKIEKSSNFYWKTNLLLWKTSGCNSFNKVSVGFLSICKRIQNIKLAFGSSLHKLNRQKMPKTAYSYSLSWYSNSILFQQWAEFLTSSSFWTILIVEHHFLNILLRNFSYIGNFASRSSQKIPIFFYFSSESKFSSSKLLCLQKINIINATFRGFWHS